MLTIHRHHIQIIEKYGIKIYVEKEAWKNIGTPTAGQAKFNVVHYLSSSSS